MMRCLGVLLAVIVTGCTGQRGLGPADGAAVERVMEDFRLAWLANDSARVMHQVSSDVTMFVPGPAGTIAGKDQLRAYWFPSDGKAYPIRKFTVSNQSIYGGGIYAFAQGMSDLAWDTTVHDSVVSSATSKSEFLTVLRQEDGAWKIFRQIFVMR